MSAYCPNFKHDLFVSYGCVDNQSADSAELGWVTCFVEDLQRRVAERLGRRDTFSVWRDERQLLRHVNLEEQIAEAINGSACMLIVLSPGYLNSNWCDREREIFLKCLHERQNTQGLPLFVIERDQIEEKDRPQEFKNVLGFQFWTGDPNNQANLPRPLDKNRPADRDAYHDLINRLAHSLVKELRLRRGSPSRNAVRPSQDTNEDTVARVSLDPISFRTSTVFLAEVTDDLHHRWKKLQAEFDQHGVRVVSGGPPRDAAQLESSVSLALQESQVYVQLLSQFPGRPLPGTDETYPSLQYRLAKESGVRILQWRDPSITEETYEKQDLGDPELTSRHRDLLFGPVRAEHFEDFKSYVAKEATTPPRPEPQPTGTGMIFVSFNPASSDSSFAEDLCGYLAQKGFGVVTQVESADADPEEIREDFENNVLDSRSWIVVYGDHKHKIWVRRQLSEINQLLCEHKKQSGSIHLCAAPPAPKDVNSALKLVGIQLPQMKVIDCQSGFEIENLYQFLDELSHPVGHAANEGVAGDVVINSL